MTLPSIFRSIQKLNRLIRMSQFISTTPFSTMQKLEMVLVSAIDHFQPLLQPEMVRIQPKKEGLQNYIKKLVDDIQEIEETLESKKTQLVQLRSDLETLVADEEKETSPSKMDQTIKEIKAHLIEELTGSSSASSSSSLAEPKSDRCQISRNGLIGINSAFENCLQSAEKFDDLDESTCWTLLKEVGITLEKIGKIEAKLVGSENKDPLKSMMVNWVENLLVGQIMEELDGIVDAEEASRLMLSLEMISKGLKIVRLPRWMIKTAAAKLDDENQPESLFEICTDDSSDQQECDRIVALMERAGVFSRNVVAKDEITQQIMVNSISPTQLLMRIDELVLYFPVKYLAKGWISKFLKTQRQQMLEELNEHLKRVESPKASLDADDNQICLFVPVSSSLSSSSAELTTTRLKYLVTPVGLSAPSSEEGLEKRGREFNASAEAHQIFEKVQLLVSEIESILQIEESDSHPIVTAAINIEAEKPASSSPEVIWRKLDQFFNSVFEANDEERPNEMRNLDGCTKITNLYLSGIGIQSLPTEISQLRNLQNLFLNQNQLTSVPVEIGQLTNLETLALSSNQLTSVPVEIGHMKNLQNLFLNQNQLTSVPVEISHLTNLQQLFFGSNQLTSVPVEIGHMKNLRTLELSENQLTSVPVEIGSLKTLQQLFFGSNQLTSVAVEISQLMNLETLDLHQNQLTSLPTEIGHLINLQTLDLSRNQLTSVPAEIGQLTSLQTLDLRNNSNLSTEFQKRDHPFFANLKELDSFFA